MTQRYPGDSDETQAFRPYPPEHVQGREGYQGEPPQRGSLPRGANRAGDSSHSEDVVRRLSKEYPYFRADYSDDRALGVMRDWRGYLPSTISDNRLTEYARRLEESQPLNPKHLDDLIGSSLTHEKLTEFEDHAEKGLIKAFREFQGDWNDVVTDYSNEAAKSEELQARVNELHITSDQLGVELEDTHDKLEAEKKKFTYTAVGAGVLLLALIGALWWGSTRDHIPDNPTEAQQEVVKLQQDNRDLQDKLAAAEKDAKDADQRAKDAVDKSNNPDAARELERLNRDVENKNRELEQAKSDNERLQHDVDRAQQRNDSLESELREAQRGSSNPPVTVTQTVPAPSGNGNSHNGNNGDNGGRLSNLNPFN